MDSFNVNTPSIYDAFSQLYEVIRERREQFHDRFTLDHYLSDYVFQSLMAHFTLYSSLNDDSGLGKFEDAFYVDVCLNREYVNMQLQTDDIDHSINSLSTTSSGLTYNNGMAVFNGSPSYDAIIGPDICLLRKTVIINILKSTLPSAGGREYIFNQRDYSDNLGSRGLFLDDKGYLNFALSYDGEEYIYTLSDNVCDGVKHVIFLKFKDSNKIDIYIDETLIDTATFDISLFLAKYQGVFMVGVMDYRYPTYSYVGKISNVRIINDLITDEELIDIVESNTFVDSYYGGVLFNGKSSRLCYQIYGTPPSLYGNSFEFEILKDVETNSIENLLQLTSNVHNQASLYINEEGYLYFKNINTDMVSDVKLSDVKVISENYNSLRFDIIDSTNVQIYVNGVKYGMRKLSVPINLTLSNVRFGHSFYSPYYYYRGLMRNISIKNNLNNPKDVTQPNADGFHKKITLPFYKEHDNINGIDKYSPDYISGSNILFTKKIGVLTELCARKSDGVHQITDNGKLSPLKNTFVYSTDVASVGLLKSANFILFLAYRDKDDKINLYYSKDSGTTWTLSFSGESCYNDNIDIIYTGSKYLLSFNKIKGNPVVYSSTDYKNWSIVYEVKANGTWLEPLFNAGSLVFFKGITILFLDNNVGSYIRTTDLFSTTEYRLPNVMPSGGKLLKGSTSVLGNVLRCVYKGTSMSYIIRTSDGVTWNTSNVYPIMEGPVKSIQLDGRVAYINHGSQYNAPLITFCSNLIQASNVTGLDTPAGSVTDIFFIDNKYMIIVANNCIFRASAWNGTYTKVLISSTKLKFVSSKKSANGYYYIIAESGFSYCTRDFVTFTQISLNVNFDDFLRFYGSDFLLRTYQQTEENYGDMNVTRTEMFFTLARIDDNIIEV